MKNTLKKQILSLTLATAMIAGTCGQSVFAASADTTVSSESAIRNSGITWFKDQLSGRALSMYQALTDLSLEGGLITGTASTDLIGKGYISADDVTAYINGDSSLAEDFHQALDAFFYDNPSIFYIDREKLNLRVGMKGSAPSAEIGKGKNDNYYADGFSSSEQVAAAVSELESRISAMLAHLSGSSKEMITSVHDYITANTEYIAAEQAGTDGSYVGTAYGALVKGKAICGGYSEAFKIAMDRLGIPSVLVYGIGENSLGEKESHQWNYVQLDGQWFAVDVTWDDPIGGTPRNTYLLNGAAEFTGHIADPTLSPNGRTFEYPTLFEEGYAQAGQDANSQSAPLSVTAADGTDSDGDNYTSYKFNYNGMGVKEAYAKDKLIFVSRYSEDGVNWNEWVDLSYYADVEVSNSVSLYSGYTQFAVTSIKMDGKFAYKTDLSEEGKNVAISEVFKINENEVKYVPAPTLIRSTPSVQAAIRPGTKSVSITFSDNLEQTGEIGIDVTSSQNYLNYSISNVKWSNGTEEVNLGDYSYTRETSTVTFDFTTDASYNTHNAVYEFQVKGLEGTSSQKAPNTFRYLTKLNQVVNCGIYSTLFTGVSPRLVSDDYAAVYAGQPVNRTGDTSFILTATKNGVSQNFALDADCRTNATASTTRKHVTLAVPYPTGYDINNDGEGISFSAVSMEKQADGSYKAVPAKCVITAKGLEVKLDR